MPMKPREMIQLLERNGFKFVRSNGSHQVYRNDETQRQVVVPVHAKDLKQGTEKQILKMAGLK